MSSEAKPDVSKDGSEAGQAPSEETRSEVTTEESPSSEAEPSALAEKDDAGSVGDDSATTEANATNTDMSEDKDSDVMSEDNASSGDGEIVPAEDSGEPSASGAGSEADGGTADVEDEATSSGAEDCILASEREKRADEAIQKERKYSVAQGLNMHGWLDKRGGPFKAFWQQRYFRVVHGDSLVWSMHCGMKFIPQKNAAQVTNLMTFPHDPRLLKVGLRLDGQLVTRELRAPSADDARLWATALLACVARARNKRRRSNLYGKSSL